MRHSQDDVLDAAPRRLFDGCGEQRHETFAALQAELLVPGIRCSLIMFERFRQNELFEHAQGVTRGKRQRCVDSLDMPVKPTQLLSRTDVRAIEGNRAAIARPQDNLANHDRQLEVAVKAGESLEVADAGDSYTRAPLKLPSAGCSHAGHSPRSRRAAGRDRKRRHRFLVYIPRKNRGSPCRTHSPWSVIR